MLVAVMPGSGWLGSRSRRRTWHAVISLGEAHAAFEPKISECDFVHLFEGVTRECRPRGELKHLSSPRSRNQLRFP